jgi:Nucleoside-diphosphate-sugar epimerases
MRVAVSGASGFIGQYVLQELQSRGLNVIALTHSAARRPPPSEASRWIVMDIANPPSNPFEAMGSPDALIHLAWGGLPNYQSSHHLEVELPAQLAFLTSCVRNGLKRLVVAGTCYEYGLASGELAEDAPTQPCTQYGLAKNMLREALFGLRVQYDLDLAWLRLFYLYGDGQSEKSLYRMLRTAIDRGAKTFDMSGGEQLRDFLPAHEAARLIVEIAQRENVSGIFNVCSGKPIAVRELVQSWIEASGAKITMNLGQLPYSPSEPMAFWGAREKLNIIVDGTTKPNKDKPDRHGPAPATPSTNLR